MSQTKNLLTDAATIGPGPVRSIPPELVMRSLVVSLTGNGAIAATVVMEVSNDGGATWATRLTFSLSGSGSVTDTDVDSPSPFPMVRGNVTTISGTGAAVSLALCAV